MALHDESIPRQLVVSGLSVVADALSAVKYAKVKVVRNENSSC